MEKLQEKMMKLTYLGTAAAEGVPAVFCNCEYCREARLKGGKNVRTRPQALINDDLLMDYPCDSYMHALTGKYHFDKIKSVIFTHSHPDHCYTKDFDLRHEGFAHGMEIAELHLYGGEGIRNRFLRECGTADFPNVRFHLVRVFETFTADKYKITPLPARHLLSEDAFIYVIERDGKRILFAHDTGYFFEETFAYIERKKLRFDFVSYDCTIADNYEPDEGGHMGFENIKRVRNRLKSCGAIDSETIEYVSHFSHNNNPIQERLEKIAESFSLGVAYDGCVVEI